MEQWKPIPGYWDYEASTKGRIRSNKYFKKRICKPYKEYHGPLRVGLSVEGKVRRMYVHRLVVNAFLKPKKKYWVSHLDGDVTNNNLTNLAVRYKKVRTKGSFAPQ